MKYLNYIVIAVCALFLSYVNADAQNTVNKAGTVIELNSEDFNQKVYDIKSENPEYLGKLPAIVDFTANWCGPCRKIAPILDEIAKEYSGTIMVYKVDIDKNRDLTEAFGINSIPSILYIPLEGKAVMTGGARDKATFIKEIDSFIYGKSND